MRAKNIYAALGAVLLALAWVLPSSGGMSSPSYEILCDVLDNGGTRSASAGFRNVSVIGQPTPTGVSGSASYRNYAGYLAQLTVPTASDCSTGHLCLTVYLNGHWAGIGYRASQVDIELYDAGLSPVDSFFDVALDDKGLADVDLGSGGVLEGSYYVVVRHLNHIDLVSTGMVSLSLTGSNAMDFSDPLQVACGESALIWEATNGGKWVMPGGDASGDGNVNIFDYFSMGQQWGGAGPHSDYTGDGAVNIFDYFILGQNWGRSDCPDVP
ncbi:hypothetical protein ACFL4G_06010 [Thermodesulfobacteriota bacterium]